MAGFFLPRRLLSDPAPAQIQPEVAASADDKSKPPVELVVCEALEGPATGRVSRRTEKFTNRITVTGRR